MARQPVCPGRMIAWQAGLPRRLGTTRAILVGSGAVVVGAPVAVAARAPETVAVEDMSRFCKGRLSAKHRADPREIGTDEVERGESVAERDRQRSCAGEAAEANGRRPQDILALPVERDPGGLVVYGQDPPEGAAGQHVRGSRRQLGPVRDGLLSGRAERQVARPERSGHEAGPAGDAAVPGTDHHATGGIPCSRGGGQPTGSCPFGVRRRGDASGTVTVTKPDARTRSIVFEKGRATGYDASRADPGEFRATREGDLSIVRIGPERYEIPDAVIFAGSGRGRASGAAAGRSRAVSTVGEPTDETCAEPSSCGAPSPRPGRWHGWRSAP